MAWTRLEAANKILFQWFFVRLIECRDSKSGELVGRALWFGIFPLSGWTGEYFFPFGRKWVYIWRSWHD